MSAKKSKARKVFILTNQFRGLFFPSIFGLDSKDRKPSDP